MHREDGEGKSTGLLSKLSGVVGGLGGSRHGSRHNAESGSMSGSRGRVLCSHKNLHTGTARLL